MADLSGLMERIKAAAEVALAKTAKEVGWKLGHAYDRTIASYYGSYSPIMYHRTGAFGKGSNWAAGENLVSGGGDSYTVNLHVSDAYIPGEPYAKTHGWKIPQDWTKSDIGTAEWLFGTHGGAAVTASPHSMMAKEFTNITAQVPAIVRKYFKRNF